MVKVKGHDREDAREVTRPPMAPANEDRDNNEEDDQGVSRSNWFPWSSAELGKNNEDFQEILNEIDVGLSKYDGPAMNCSLPRTETSLILPSGVAKSPEVQLLSPIEGSFPLGGHI
nr:hypothetical protein CFP56_53003 [Quercus suber]